jgi:hypothetical protein
VDYDKYAANLGKIVANLHALEFSIRIFMCDIHRENYTLPHAGDTMVPLSHLTNFDTLGQLIQKYNACLLPNERQYEVDPEIVGIRDAIAHGRAVGIQGVFTLYKFGRPNHVGMVPVEFSQELDHVWVNDTLKNTDAFLENIKECSLSRGYRAFS